MKNRYWLIIAKISSDYELKTLQQDQENRWKTFDTTFLGMYKSNSTKLSSVASHYILFVSVMELCAWLIPDVMVTSS